MRYRLSTLLVLVTFGPMVLAGLWINWSTIHQNVAAFYEAQGISLRELIIAIAAVAFAAAWWRTRQSLAAAKREVLNDARAFAFLTSSSADTDAALESLNRKYRIAPRRSSRQRRRDASA